MRNTLGQEERPRTASAWFPLLAGISSTCCRHTYRFSTSTNCISNPYRSIAFIFGLCQHAHTRRHRASLCKRGGAWPGLSLER